MILSVWVLRSDAGASPRREDQAAPPRAVKKKTKKKTQQKMEKKKKKKKGRREKKNKKNKKMKKKTAASEPIKQAPGSLPPRRSHQLPISRADQRQLQTFAENYIEAEGGDHRTKAGTVGCVHAQYQVTCADVDVIAYAASPCVW